MNGLIINRNNVYALIPRLQTNNKYGFSDDSHMETTLKCVFIVPLVSWRECVDIFHAIIGFLFPCELLIDLL